MLDNIIDKNIVFLQKYGVEINSDDDRAVYRYGLQILYYTVVDLVLIFSLAYMFDRLYQTAIMIFIFGLLQIFGGGYHAKTPLKCLLTMISGVVVGNIIIVLVADKFIFNIVLSIVVSSIIFVLTPVTNKKHPVSKKVKFRSKLIIRATVILILTALIILNYFNKFNEVTIISITVSLYLISLTIAKIND